MAAKSEQTGIVRDAQTNEAGEYTLTNLPPGRYEVADVALPGHVSIAGIPGKTHLTFRGGPTETHGLLDGSPAIDRGEAPCAVTDQRGVTRPQGAACDLGPVEVTTLPPYISSSGLAGRVGEPVAAKIRASGLPPASLTVTGAIPAGLTSTQQADGSYLISGTPELGTGAAYPLEATATSTAPSVDSPLA